MPVPPAGSSWPPPPFGARALGQLPLPSGAAICEEGGGEVGPGLASSILASSIFLASSIMAESSLLAASIFLASSVLTPQSLWSVVLASSASLVLYQ